MSTVAEERRSGRLHDVRTVAVRTFAEARDDRITTTAQALAYSLFLAIPAVLLVVLGVFSIVASPEDVDGVIARLEGVIPPEAAGLLSDSLDRSVAVLPATACC